jgi:hypothetical protein
MRKLTVIIDDSDMSHSVFRDTTKTGKKRPVSKPDRHIVTNTRFDKTAVENIELFIFIIQFVTIFGIDSFCASNQLKSRILNNS